MTARLIMSQPEIDRDRARWFVERRKGIGASEIAAVLGLAPESYGSAFALFTAKQSGFDWDEDNDSKLWGRFVEPYVSDVFARNYPSLSLLGGGLYQSVERPWQLATFDRLAFDVDEWGIRSDELTEVEERYALSRAVPVQIKSSATEEGWGEPGTGQIPVHYRAQCLQEMDVADAHAVWVPVLFPPHKVVTYVILRTQDVEEDIQLLREAGEEFIMRLMNDDPPPIDWTSATAAALRTLHPVKPSTTAEIPKFLAKRYRRAQLAKSVSKQRLKQVENEIRGRIGGADRAVVKVAGRDMTVLTRRVSHPERVDIGLLRQQRPEIAKEFTKTGTVDALYPGKYAK
jgi:putative phage-type endonuclease